MELSALVDAACCGTGSRIPRDLEISSVKVKMLCDAVRVWDLLMLPSLNSLILTNSLC